MRQDFVPTATPENLRLRAALLAAVRAFFVEQGFLEVETPILSADTVVDRHLDPFSVEVGFDPRSASRRMFMQTSPEFGMKRLLAAGEKAIYQICKVFRRDEEGPLHNPEFTMVEWYRVGDDLAKGMRLLDDLSQATLRRGPAERVSYREAFQRWTAVDPFVDSTEKIVAAVRERGISAPESMPTDDRDGWLDMLLVELVQPRLGFDRPAILYDFPPSQAALSRVRQEDADEFAMAERFELYVEGIELANGYNELLDADQLLRRNRAANLLRQADGKEALPDESRLLDAMRSGLPPCAGTALGFDRLVMLVAGAKSVAEVVSFPFDRA